MNIQDLGSLGELVGAFAVVFALIYLAIQTRQARIAAEESAKHSQIQATYKALWGRLQVSCCIGVAKLC